MQARVYQPAKPAVSSGRFKTRFWLVEFEPRSAQRPDRLIGWIGSDDTDRQLSLRFDTRDEAIAYCERRGIDFVVIEPHKRVVRPKAYADNFIRRT
jgi:hypothetical protein